MVVGFLGPAFVLTLAIHRLCVFLGLALFVAIWFAPLFCGCVLVFGVVSFTHVETCRLEVARVKQPGSRGGAGPQAPLQMNAVPHPSVVAFVFVACVV